MFGKRCSVATVVGLVGAAVLAGSGISPAGASAPTPPAPQAVGRAHHHPVCGRASGQVVRCHVSVVDRSASDPTPLVSSVPWALDPATIKSVYGFPTDPTAGAGTTIAIVDAYNDPTVQADLDQFDLRYGLTCAGCLATVNQTGGTALPATDGGWALEISLDVQWAHAIAPAAHILLVEANSPNMSDLIVAEDYAKAHASYVSNSWGGGEFADEVFYDNHFQAPGVSFFVSAGDTGLPAEYPSSSPNVISVGGTSLSNIGTPSFAETAWTGGGGGCSVYELATAAQHTFATYGQVNCRGTRATPDVSLDGDPNSGVSVYDSTPNGGSAGWYKVGGTSASAPMWAARAAVAGGVMDSARVYGVSPPPFRDITSGSNGAPALVGYDLASGRGSWNDIVPAKAMFGAPTDGAAGVATSATFSWSPATGNGVQGYYLVIGTTQGGYDVVNSGVLPSSTTSMAATLPAGRTLFARIYSVRNGSYGEYADISFATVAKGLFTAPTDGAAAVPTAATFAWSAATGPGAQGYYLVVGTTPGGFDVVNSGVLPLATTSLAATLPAGRSLFARLYSVRNGSYGDFADITFATVAKATFIGLTDGASGVPTAATFTWSPASGPGAQGYYLVVGTTRGGFDVVNSGVLPLATTSLAATLPAGRTLFARLYSIRNGSYSDYADASFATVAKALFLTPIDGAAGIPSAGLFTWAPALGPGAQGYYLVVGTIRGGFDVVNSGVLPLATTSLAATLPSGRSLFARLYSIRTGSYADFSDISFTTL